MVEASTKEIHFLPRISSETGKQWHSKEETRNRRIQYGGEDIKGINKSVLNSNVDVKAPTNFTACDPLPALERSCLSRQRLGNFTQKCSQKETCDA